MSIDEDRPAFRTDIIRTSHDFTSHHAYLHKKNFRMISPTAPCS